MKISTIEAHAAGEPLRVITEGFPPLPGKTMTEKRRLARKKWDRLRTALMWEPRGHADMYGALITDPVTPDGDLGVLFLHNEGFSTMCGHGIIALTTVIFETDCVPLDKKKSLLRIDSPAGRVTVRAQMKGKRVHSVSFVNVPSFVFCMDREVEVPKVGRVPYDIAFGGAFYAFCRAETFGLDLKPENHRELIHIGRAVKTAVAGVQSVTHPENGDLGFLYGTIFIGPPHHASHHSRNVCVFADGELDRSPTGTGLSARAALHYARRELKIGETFAVESILGTVFKGKIIKTGHLGSYESVIPEISGSAYITGRNEFRFDSRDPLRFGFFLG